MSKQNRPSDQYPELYNAVAQATYHIRKAHELMSGHQIAPKFGVKPQSYNEKVLRANNADKFRNDKLSRTAPVAMEEEVSGR